MSGTEKACTGTADSVVHGEPGEGGGLVADGEATDDTPAYLSENQRDDQDVVEPFSEEVTGDKNETGNVSNNAISEASLDQCVKEIDPECSTFSDSENIHAEAKHVEEVSSPSNNKHLDEQNCTHGSDTSVKNSCESDEGVKEGEVMFEEEESALVRRPETESVCQTTVEDDPSQLQTEIQQDSSNGSSSDKSSGKEDTCNEVKTINSEQSSSVSNVDSVSSVCHNEEDSGYCGKEQMKCEGDDHQSGEGEGNSEGSSGAQSNNECIVGSPDVPLPEDSCEEGLVACINKTQIDDTSPESTGEMDINKSTLLETEIKPGNRQSETTTEKSYDTKPVTPAKTSRDKDELSPSERVTKISKELGNSEEETRSDTPTKESRLDVKTSSGPAKVSQISSPKSPAGRETRGPTKQRYSEQRQRKNMSRALEKSDKKDSKGKDLPLRKEQSRVLDFLGCAISAPLLVAKPSGPTAAELEAKWQKEEEDKKAQEEEKRKEEERQREEKLKEEERQRAKEEERLKAEEEQRKIDEELKLLEDYISDAKEKIESKAELRDKNIAEAENRPDESFFSKLDSNLKKNTAFVKKLKNLTDSQKDSLIKDFSSLNLSKYIGECAAGIAEAKLKMSDVNCGVALSSLLHQRYADFSSNLLENWQKFLLNKKDEKIPNPSKYRVDLRFFAELLSVRVFTQKEGLPILANQLSILVNNDKEEHNNLSTISSFCKHCGDDYAGLIPRRIRELAESHNREVPRSQVLPPERQKACRNLLKDYYQSLCKHLTKDHKDLKSLERQNLRTLQTKGELSGEKKDMYEASLTAYQKLHANTATLSDLLDEPMPDLPEEDFKQDPESAAFDVFNPMRNAEYQYEGDTNLFEDEETRSFYENLSDLKAFIPGILYKESEQATTKDAIKDVDTGMEESLAVEDVEKEMETEKSLAEIEQQALEKEEQENPGSVMAVDDEDLPPHMSVPDVQPYKKRRNDDGETVSLMKSQFEAYLQSLPNCVNRELIDKAAVEFCMNFNTKSNRKKLVKALFTVHRTRYDLLPFYSRYVATLYPCMPDVANDLVHLIKGDFKWHVRKKDQINIESKLKTVRFMGEMVKFNMFPKSESLHCLKMLMLEFSHHNIEMACSLLETCGRYLYRSPESHHRTKVYLDVMMRKKAALHLDGRYITMIENAYYYSNPPDTPQLVRKERPPLHEYMRKLLYKELSKTTTEKVLRQMRKLDWDDPQVAFYATKCLTAVWNVRYNSVHCVANLLAGLAPYREIVAIQVVDGVLEDIRIGMEVNHPKYNQRRVSAVKYLGELYNYRMVESVVIFKTLYSFISFGVSLDESAPTHLDPPEHLFRLRLTCVLLDTCGQYFDKGSSKKKLDYFLVYFQRYYWFKRNCQLWSESRPFPIDIMNMVQDTFETIRPKLKMHESYEAASKAAEELGNEFKTKLAKVLPQPEVKDGGDTGNFDDPALTTIQESEENDELSQNLSQTPLTDDGPSTADSQTSADEGHTGSQTNEGDRRRSTLEEEEDILESAGEDETDDQVTVLSGGPKYVNCSEDNDFMAAFDKMMVDNIQARNSESLKVPQLDIAVPMHLRGQKKTYYPQDQGSINFVLMTRKGNKQQFSNLNVPISEEFAAKFKERERAEKAEKERMKQVVLGIHERQEEEDYQEMIASLNRPVPANTNRERRVRYQHPKGAPDADLIFGSK
ncbi:regulator of nonsense transcripts 2-like isoform X2 [Liolophura sinensis]